jgi:hypothetical protein
MCYSPFRSKSWGGHQKRQCSQTPCIFTRLRLLLFVPKLSLSLIFYHRTFTTYWCFLFRESMVVEIGRGTLGFGWKVENYQGVPYSPSDAPHLQLSRHPRTMNTFHNSRSKGSPDEVPTRNTRASPQFPNLKWMRRPPFPFSPRKNPFSTSISTFTSSPQLDP